MATAPAKFYFVSRWAPDASACASYIEWLMHFADRAIMLILRFDFHSGFKESM